MAGIAGDSQLFHEHFTITTYDQNRYDRVARIGGTSHDSQTVMTLDVNTELYPCVGHQKLNTMKPQESCVISKRSWEKHATLQRPEPRFLNAPLELVGGGSHP